MLKRRLLAAALLVAACDDGGPVDTFVPADVGGLDAEVDAADVSNDADEAPNEATLEHAGRTVRVQAVPFELSFRDTEGRGFETRAAAAPAYPAFAVAVTTLANPRAYHNPLVPKPERYVWYMPTRVVSTTYGRDAGPNVTFTVETGSTQGDPGPTVTFTVSLADEGMAFESQVSSPVAHTVLTLDAPVDEGFYGFGELFDRVDARGSLREMQVQANGESESAVNEVHVPIPFFMSTNGYGFFSPSRAPTAFDVASVQDVVRVVVNDANPIWRATTGATPESILRWYIGQTGRPAIPPYWALGPQWWRNENRDAAELLDDAQRALDADIPSSVVWIDRPWSSYYHNWTMNPSQFPDPAGMVATLREQGLAMILHHSPQLNAPGQSDLGADEDASDGLFAKYDANGWLVKYANGSNVVFPWGGGQGAFIDYTHPDAVADVQELIKRATDIGILGTKMDWDEFLQPNLGDTRLDMEFSNGETNQTMKSWYSALYHKAIVEGFDRNADQPTFHISRTGAPGDQVWNTCIWPGDLDNDFSPHTRGPSDFQDKWNVGGMPAAVIANQTLGLSGYPCFGSDIGGYRGGLSTEEVLIRWVAFGTFNGVMQLGGAGRSHMPWTADSIYSSQAVDAVRKYFGLRTQLFPYIQGAFFEAADTGIPVVRPMWFAYPDVPEARAHEDQFMFGADLLVAPVATEGATSRPVWVPPGQWVDFWTGDAIMPGIVDRPAPLDVIPVLVKAGAILPLAAPTVRTLVPTPSHPVVSYDEVDVLHWWVVPGPASRKTAFNGLTLEMDAEAKTLKVTSSAPRPGLPEAIAKQQAVQVVHVQGGEAPTAVRIDAVEVTLGDCDGCYQWDAGRRLVTVTLNVNETVTIARP